jgi:hypothetical protein
MHPISETVERKFVDTVLTEGWEVLTDTGWHPIIEVSKTVPYMVFVLKLDNGMELSCADTHIVFDQNHNERFVKDLKSGELIQTSLGLSQVLMVKATDQAEHMYDLSVDSNNHRYYTNGILSHNTTTAAGYLLWYASFHPDVTVLIAANKFKAANEIMLRIKYAYEELPNHIRPGVVEYNVTSIRFDNGSRVLATTTTPDSGRGLAISLLYLDEFAFVKPRMAREFWSAIAPTLATGGKCIITSTPQSDEDMFAEIWHGATATTDEEGNDIPDGIGVNGFKAFTASYDEVPGRDEEWAAKERAKIGEEKFEREYLCRFVGEESTLVSSLSLQRLRGMDPIFKTHGDVRWYDKITADRTYLVSLDPSAGVGRDGACIEVWSLPDMAQIAEWVSNKTSIPNQVKTMQTVINTIYSEVKKAGYKGEPEIYFTLENNTWGEAALQTVNDIGEENFNGQFLHEPKKPGTGRSRKGLNTNGRSKSSACSKLKSLVESNKLQIRSKMLIKQLKFFVAKGDGFAAKSGENDDCVMSTMLCVRMMQMVTNWDDKVGELMKDAFDNDEQDSHRDPMPFSVLIR